mmetsp:Transcript_101040/g.326138  ORF Transcript_101040/g.326138 Transcript_101040/m.326138 type:complete len:238 (+) Transcript_101040:99-812(+)
MRHRGLATSCVHGATAILVLATDWDGHAALDLLPESSMRFRPGLGEALAGASLPVLDLAHVYGGLALEHARPPDYDAHVARHLGLPDGESNYAPAFVRLHLPVGVLLWLDLVLPGPCEELVAFDGDANGLLGNSQGHIFGLGVVGHEHADLNGVLGLVPEVAVRHRAAVARPGAAAGRPAAGLRRGGSAAPGLGRGQLARRLQHLLQPRALRAPYAHGFLQQPHGLRRVALLQGPLG